MGHSMCITTTWYCDGHCAVVVAALWSSSFASSRMQESSSSQVERRLVVGLTGYPNVGKSSTINALFGELPPLSYLNRAHTLLQACSALPPC
jgi:predicted GTPase